ncbi:MAG: 4Fe-4S dicluster domain-containing protein, partial [Candidatus Omnitrophica bacterium]|nr:4Fe-4S dicluster domain-containing protein [Candidatus Omnitrophota bacterium]
RSRRILRSGMEASWDDLTAALADRLKDEETREGDTLRILTEPVFSPSLAAALRAVFERFPRAKWHQYHTFNRDNARAGAILAFGEDTHEVFRVDRADVLVSLGSDFLYDGPGSVRYAGDFARRRDPQAPGGMNRLYVAESTPSVTGLAADHRLALRSSHTEILASAVFQRLGFDVHARFDALGRHATRWAKTAAKDLVSHAGRSLILAGRHQPPIVHAMCHLMNGALGNIGKTVMLTRPIEEEPADQMLSITSLRDDLLGGKVRNLIVLGGNPVYKAPKDLALAKAFARAEFKLHWGRYTDETARCCDWHVPATHWLESWSDARAYDGTVSIVQPVVAPLYGGVEAYKILSEVSGQKFKSAYRSVRDYWKKEHSALFESFTRDWRRTLHEGVLAGSAFEPRALSPQSGFAINVQKDPPPDDLLDIEFIPDPSVGEGDGANNPWLQELPRPVTRLVWENAALISPATASREGLRSGDVAVLSAGERRLEVPVLVVPGQAEGTVTLSAGAGRSSGGRVLKGAGIDVNELRLSSSPWRTAGASIRKTSKRHVLAVLQKEERARKDTVGFSSAKPEGFYPDAPVPQSRVQWGMVIDLSRCIGCGACTAACQAENNIPVVGRKEAMRGRWMHWMRVERFFNGSGATATADFRPVPCMHCEKAPCETACPVTATTHSREGLNEMIYNRCVGTRYCSQNCPYKVRRFNFYEYADLRHELYRLRRNPDVTVRTRGVIEKCTYCVQRINAARITARKEGREMRDGEVRTACQQACPTGAISFGNINDPGSAVARLRASRKAEVILGDLGTRPRTIYLPRATNPHWELESS